LQAVDEGVCLHRLPQFLVAGVAAHGKVSGQIVVGIPIAIGATAPDLLAAHALTHGIEHEELVADAVDSLASFLVALDDQLASTGSDDAADWDDFVESERPRLAANVALQQLHGLDDRLVRVVIRAKLECIEQWWQKATVVRLIRTRHRLLELAAIARSNGHVLADQVAQEALTADNGENDIPHNAVGPFNRGLGHAEQQPELAGDAARVRQKLLLDPVLGSGVDPLDRLDKCVDQIVRQFTRARQDLAG